MNGFGEFLYTLRKEKGMTQAELAQKLGVTNKAVSKWETGEAMPETALLIPLSRIFEVSVDELLDGKRNERTADDKSKADIKAHLFTRGKGDKDEKSFLDKISGLLCAVIIFAGNLAYLLIGILYGMWHPYWVIIPACAMLCGVTGIIFDLCNTRKRKEKIAKGENPFIGSICGIIMILSITAFLLSGALTGLWHPLWIIVVVGSFLCATAAMVGEIINYRKK